MLNIYIINMLYILLYFCASFFLNGSMVSFGNKYALVAHILHKNKNKNGWNGLNFDLIANI